MRKYSLRDDGGVRVINRGYSAEKGEWEEAEARSLGFSLDEMVLVGDDTP